MTSEIQERAKENKQNAMKEANKNNPNHENNGLDSVESQPSKNESRLGSNDPKREPPPQNQHC